MIFTQYASAFNKATNQEIHVYCINYVLICVQMITVSAFMFMLSIYVSSCPRHYNKLILIVIIIVIVIVIILELHDCR